MKYIFSIVSSICLLGLTATAFAQTSQPTCRAGLLGCVAQGIGQTVNLIIKPGNTQYAYNRQYNGKRYDNRYYTTSQRYQEQRQYAYNSSDRYRGGQRVFVFDPKRLSWYAYHNGRLVSSGRASGGSHYCRDVGRSCRTPVGSFRVHAKRGADCVSSKYPLNRNQPRARMPYCNFFRGGYAVHGHDNVPNYNASHGCIRVKHSAAYWLYHNFLHHGTKVIVRPYR